VRRVVNGDVADVVVVDADMACLVDVAVADIFVLGSKLRDARCQTDQHPPPFAEDLIRPDKLTSETVDAPVTAANLMETPICLVSVNKTFPQS
jgi:hypothetical protein